MMRAKQDRFSGNFPIVPTAFGDDGEVDEASQRALLEYLIAAGVHGLVILANASEGFALSDEERERLARLTIGQVNHRVPVVVTISHYSSLLTARRAAEAEKMGADAIMATPPFYGTWAPDLNGVFEHFKTIAGAVSIPIVIQDHPVSSIQMPIPFLARLATELPTVKYFKIETPNAPWKIAGLLDAAGSAFDGAFGGMNGTMLIQELDNGACGTMPSSSLPDVFARICELYREGQRAETVRLYRQYLPLIDFEARLAGRNTAKEILALGGIVRSAHVRLPGPVQLDPLARSALHDLLKDADILALRYRRHC
jgi:2-keto-3-deoxy-L-arabinonate dehydratase